MKESSEKTQDVKKSEKQNFSLESNGNGTAQLVDNRSTISKQRKLQTSMSSSGNEDINPIQRKANNTGFPDKLKSGIENLSGYSMDDVKVHYNSSKPAQLQAHAYAQGTDIHLASGQEKHLPHEAWHVVQQKQGRVKPTKQLKSKVNINDDAGLEREADVMGAKANYAQGKSNHSNSDYGKTHGDQNQQGQQVMQRMKVDNGAGGINIVNVTPQIITNQVNQVNMAISARLVARNQATRDALNEEVMKLEVFLANWQSEDYSAYKTHMKNTTYTLRGTGLNGNNRSWDGDLWKQAKQVIDSLVVDKQNATGNNASVASVLDRAEPALLSAARRYAVANAGGWGYSQFGKDRINAISAVDDKLHFGSKNKALSAMCSDFQNIAVAIIRNINRHIIVEKVGSTSAHHNWVVVGRDQTSNINNPAGWGPNCETIDLWEGAIDWEGDQFDAVMDPLNDINIRHGNNYDFNYSITSYVLA